MRLQQIPCITRRFSARVSSQSGLRFGDAGLPDPLLVQRGPPALPLRGAGPPVGGHQAGRRGHGGEDHAGAGPLVDCPWDSQRRGATISDHLASFIFGPLEFRGRGGGNTGWDWPNGNVFPAFYPSWIDEFDLQGRSKSALGCAAQGGTTPSVAPAWQKHTLKMEAEKVDPPK